jgi:hypothetical protein
MSSTVIRDSVVSSPNALIITPSTKSSLSQIIPWVSMYITLIPAARAAVQRARLVFLGPDTNTTQCLGRGDLGGSFPHQKQKKGDRI